MVTSTLPVPSRSIVRRAPSVTQGFRKIAGSELIYRHSALQTPFGDTYPTGQDATDAVAEPEDEEWVMQEWKRFQGVIP